VLASPADECFQLAKNGCFDIFLVTDIGEAEKVEEIRIVGEKKAAKAANKAVMNHRTP